jgi:cysteinyl-tRNA synthetase
MEHIVPSQTSSVDVAAIREKAFAAINDDLNTPIAIAHLFDGVKMVNSIVAGKETITEADLADLRDLYNALFFEVLGFENVSTKAETKDLSNDLMQFILQIRKDAKDNKDWATADKIRDEMKALGIEIKDGKDGAEWSVS